MRFAKGVENTIFESRNYNRTEKIDIKRFCWPPPATIQFYLLSNCSFVVCLRIITVKNCSFQVLFVLVIKPLLYLCTTNWGGFVINHSEETYWVVFTSFFSTKPKLEPFFPRKSCLITLKGKGELLGLLIEHFLRTSQHREVP